MRRLWTRTGTIAGASLLVAALVLTSSGTALADTLQDTISDNGSGVTLVAGSATTGTASIRVIATGGDNDPQCNIDPGESPLRLNILTPTGVTASPNPLVLTTCGDYFAVAFTAGTTAVSGNVTVSLNSVPAGGGTYTNQVDIPITITQPAPTNTRPTVSVGGVTNAATYQIGSVPVARCNVVDTQDGNSSFAAPLSGALSHGLGTQTATCNYTDGGGLAATTATASYTIVDTGAPTISHILDPTGPNGENGWYRSYVVVDFSCADTGSGIKFCVGDTTLGEGANQSATGTATDWAGNSASETVTGINVDTIVPTISHILDPTGPNGENGWYTSDILLDFSCADGGSGIQSCVGDATIGEGASQSATGTAKDVAGNTASQTVSGLNVDKTVPTISYLFDPNGPNGANGWYTGDVTVDFSCADGGSGIDTCEGDTTLGEGTDQSATGTATDRAGHTATSTASGINVDKTDPTISYLVDPTGPNGDNGWYTGDVDVDFTCLDGGSGIETCEGDTTLGEGANQSATGTATDFAGRTRTATASGIYVDKTNPAISYLLDPNGPNGSNGWYTGDVIVDFSCSDGGSGIDSCVGDTTLGEGTDQSATGTATDFAGRTATATASGINVDKTDPTISYLVDPNGPNGSNGWYTGDVTLDFDCADGGSGIETCDGDTTLGEGADQSATGTATDFAGRTATATASGIYVDKTNPTISYVLDPNGPNGANGWYTGDVIVDFDCSDTGSGIDSCEGDTTFGEGFDQSATGTATDLAGRTSTAKASGISVDKTNPTISYVVDPNGPNGANGWYTGDVDVTFTCDDGGSGVDSCEGDTTLGEGADQSVTGTATDFAGRTASATLSGFKVDKTNPTISYVLDPNGPNGSNGWYTGDVIVDFSCSDGGSGIDSCVGDTTLGEGTDQSATGTATDFAGRTATATASGINVDKTDPTISYLVDPNGPNGSNGWYTGDVTVEFDCADGGSGIDTCEGSTTLGEGANQSATGTATDFAGRTRTATASGLNVDKTNPTISYTLDPNGPNGANGWYTGDVIVDFDCADGGSGIDTCDGDTTLGEGTDQSATGTATDFAGRTATATASGISVDKTDPTISYVLDPNGPNGENGWYTGDVDVDFTCLDGGSGIDSCVGDTTLGEGADQSAAGTATDFAGRTAGAAASGIYVDKTNPTISYALNPTGPNGANGWYTGDVTVDFTCADALSGVQYCEGDTTLGEGADQSATGTATDVAGNTTDATASGIYVDKTGPTVGFSNGPASGGSYYYGSVPAAPTCSGSDALSGLGSCVITGGGTTVGPQSYLATATDKAGNTSTATLNYTVRAWKLQGFYSPVDMGANVWNTVKGGSTVPLKFEVFAGATEFTSTSIVKSFSATTVACPGSGAALDPIEFTTTGGTALRYDSTGGQFIQNWATPKKPGTCVKVTMTTQDGSFITANFLLK